MHFWKTSRWISLDVVTNDDAWIMYESEAGRSPDEQGRYNDAQKTCHCQASRDISQDVDVMNVGAVIL